MRDVTLKDGFGIGGYLQDVFPDPESHSQPAALQSDGGAPGDLHWMQEALRVGMEGVGRTSPNPSVGCVLVHGGVLLGAGCTEAYGSRHGERVAVDALAGRVIPWNEVTAYVALEPCSHTGKQPPCVDLLVERKVGRVVVAAGDPHPLVNGGGLARLRAAGIPVEVGLLRDEAIAWNLNFFLHATGNKVVIAGKWAQSLDGHLADDANGWRWITGPRARAYTHWLRQKYDAIVVGAGTVLNDFPSLDARDCARAGQNNPLRIIFDPKGRLLSTSDDARAKLLASTLKGPDPKIIYTEGALLAAADAAWVKSLAEAGGVHFATQDTGVDPFAAFRAFLASFDFAPLRGRPLQSVLVEGGPSLLSRLIEHDALDIMHVFIAPFFLGGRRNRIAQPAGTASPNGSEVLAAPAAFPRLLGDAQRYAVIAHAKLGQDILIECLPRDRVVRAFD